MACCDLKESDFGPTNETGGAIWKVCIDCLPVAVVQVKVNIYGSSGGQAERMVRTCSRCGKRTSKKGRPPEADYSKYRIAYDWRPPRL